MKTPWVYAALFTCGLLTACTPAIGLKTQEQFTRTRVSALRKADTCRLASTRKVVPNARAQTTERTVGHTSNWLEFGRATVRLKKGPLLQKLRELLRRYYQRVPQPLLRAPLTLELDFIRRIGEPEKHASKVPLRPLGELEVLSDQSIVVRVAGDTFHLAYHPCVGELLFGKAPKPKERSTVSERLHRHL